ncbi:hypothetical protein ABEV00_22070 [Paenibacillus thiaminolyticus]|uniref:hypothetical protein n=1 Tax=Paenibacillus thiaminolyticus TaxID=49283 RepID=UPI003D2A97E1
MNNKDVIMTEQEIRDFVRALAERYKQVADEYAALGPYDLRALERYRLFQDVVKTLPEAIAGPFWHELSLLFE